MQTPPVVSCFVVSCFVCAVPSPPPAIRRAVAQGNWGEQVKVLELPDIVEATARRRCAAITKELMDAAWHSPARRGHGRRHCESYHSLVHVQL